MAKPTQLVRDDAYEQMGHAYICVQIAALDAALQQAGVTDPAVRQQICESFVFNMGNIHDQGWFKPSPESEPVYPLLCFSKRFLNSDTPLDQLGPVYAQSQFFAYHEAAFGNVESFYQNEPGALVETGSFGAEDEDTAPDAEAD
jgi:hypothetical protein